MHLYQKMDHSPLSSHPVAFAISSLFLIIGMAMHRIADFIEWITLQANAPQPWRVPPGIVDLMQCGSYAAVMITAGVAYYRWRKESGKGIFSKRKKK